MILLLAVDSSHAVWDAMVDVQQEHGNIGLKMVSLPEIFMETTNGVNLIPLLHVIIMSMVLIPLAQEMLQPQNAHKHALMEMIIQK